MKLLYIFLTMLVLGSCASDAPVELTYWKIANPTVTEERISVLMDEEPNIVNITVKGETDAPFQIAANGTTDNKLYQFKGGAVDTVLSEYWRSPVCRTRYIPKGVKTGDVNISVMLFKVDK